MLARPTPKMCSGGRQGGGRSATYPLCTREGKVLWVIRHKRSKEAWKRQGQECDPSPGQQQDLWSLSEALQVDGLAPALSPAGSPASRESSLQGSSCWKPLTPLSEGSLLTPLSQQPNTSEIFSLQSSSQESSGSQPPGLLPAPLPPSPQIAWPCRPLILPPPQTK